MRRGSFLAPEDKGSRRTLGVKVLDVNVKYVEVLSLGFQMPRNATHLSVCFFSPE